MSVDLKIEMDPRVSLKARRTLDGNILILDHEDIDIVLISEKGKCVLFPKDEMSDRVYDAQNRVFKHLASTGLINRGSVRGGNVFGALEAELLEEKIPGVKREQAFLYSIHEYMEKEKKFFRTAEKFQDDSLDNLLRPSPEDSTELGDVPQAAQKGSHSPSIRPYGFMYNYSLVREGNESEDT